MGRKYGKIVVGRIFKDSNKYLTLKRYQAGEKVLHEKGLKSIFFARFMGPLAWVTPFIAGAMQVKYKDFIKHNAPGAVVGIGLFLFAGYIFGASASMLLPKFFKGIFVIALILAAIAVWLGIGRAKRLSKIRHGFKKRI
jgi:membrane protein DedA with SNARE-associated domain